MSVQTETLPHPPDAVPRTELGRALLAAATGDLIRQADGRFMRYSVNGVELRPDVAATLDTPCFALLFWWLPLWEGHGEYAIRTEAGHQLLAEWDAELFGERA